MSKREKELHDLHAELDILHWFTKGTSCFRNIYNAIEAAKKADHTIHDVIPVLLYSIQHHYEFHSMDSLIEVITESAAEEPTADTPTVNTPTADVCAVRTPEEQVSEDDNSTPSTAEEIFNDTAHIDETSTSDTLEAVIQSFPNRGASANTLKRNIFPVPDGSQSKRKKRRVLPRTVPKPIRQVKRRMRRLQLRFCGEVLDELLAEKHTWCNRWFLVAADPEDSELLNACDDEEDEEGREGGDGIMVEHGSMVIRLQLPMCLATMNERLSSGWYLGAAHMRKDFVRMIGWTFATFPKHHIIRKAGERLKEIFEEKWSEKEEWLRWIVADIEEMRGD